MAIKKVKKILLIICNRVEQICHYFFEAQTGAVFNLLLLFSQINSSFSVKCYYSITNIMYSKTENLYNETGVGGPYSVPV